MGLLGSLFSALGDSNSGNSKGGVPSYLRNDYEKCGIDPDYVSPDPNRGKKMYCTMCGRIYNGGAMCLDCRNDLVEWN